MNRYLVLFFALSTFIYTQISHAQNRRITGIVTHSETQTPIPGASISVKGTSTGTITNINGLYQIDVPIDADVLVVSFVGMKTREVGITGPSMDIVLSPDLIRVEEVMVIAYGNSDRESFTGSASTIGHSLLSQQKNISVSRIMQGLVSGLQTATGSGQPGENAALRIRGINSFGDASPLIVVDGFPFSGNINSIPVHDIRSVSILKDAPATALYGSRAANGVIIITTASGMKEKPSFEIAATYGLAERAIPQYDKVSVSHYYELMWETMRNIRVSQGKNPQQAALEASEGLIDYLGGYNAYNVENNQVVGTNGQINTNAQLLWKDEWEKEMFRTGINREISLTAKGGSENLGYYVSASALNSEGLVKASDFNRYSARLNLESKLNHWINIGMNLSGSLADQNYPLSSGSINTNPFFFTLNIAPIFPVFLYNQNGALQTDADGSPLYDFGKEFGRNRPYAPNVNPVATTVLDTRLYRQDNGSLRSFIDFELFEGLTFKLSAGTDLYSISGINHENQKYGSSASFMGRTVRETQRTFSFVSNQMLNYSRQFGTHNFSLLAGHESSTFRQNVLSATRSGFPFPGLVELAAASTPEGSTSWEHNYRIESYLGRLDYSFREKYFISANYRTDGNSIFHKDSRWGDFWGLGLAWRVIKEEFIKDLIWLSNLKLKASYGIQGNDKIGTYYAYQGLYATGMNNLNYPGLIASRLQTPELTWEKLESFNFGLEMSILNRLALSVEYYIRNNNDLLFARPLPPSTGFNSIDTNIADLRNQGVDVEIQSKLIETANFSWNFDLNLSHYRNTIRSLPDRFIVSGNKRWEVGRSIYDFWLQDWAGVNPENGKAQWYKDELVTIDGKIQYDANGLPKTTGNRLKTEVYNEATLYYAGSAIPDLTGGIVNTFRIYDFDLTAIVNFGIGGKIYDNSYRSLMHTGNSVGVNWHSDILHRWTPENRQTDVPILNGASDVSLQSTRYLIDAGYLNLSFASVGYSLPVKLLKQNKFKGVRFYISGSNLLLKTKRPGIDPVQNFAGNSLYEYPLMQNINLGININL